jgi:enoyl-CoA hydratase/carnithine racemase
MSLVLTEDHGNVRHVILNRPEKRNAFNRELLLALHSELLAAEADADVHIVVLKGSGPVFSAGVDLGELMGQAGDISALRPFRRDFLNVPNLLEEMPKATIASIHGACLGGALEVALGCDIRVMTTDVKTGLPETRLGLIPDVGGSSRLPAVVGLGRAKELIMTGRTIDGTEAERIGLANKAVAPDELDAATDALVAELLECNPLAVGLSKRVMDASARPALAQTLEQEVTAQTICVESLAAAAREAAEPQPA